MLIKELFADFRRSFRSFFDPCEQGFINEVIIQLATRQWPKLDQDLHEKPEEVHKGGFKMEELFFVMKGAFGLYNSVDPNPRNPLPPFIVMGKNTIFGDY